MPKAAMWVRFEVFDIENMDDAEDKVYKALSDAQLGMTFQIVTNPSL
jgi:hypothetical protein